MVNELQARTIANLGAVISASLDVDQVAAFSLQNLQAATGATYLVLHLDESGPVLPDHDVNWNGNKSDRSLLHPIVLPLVKRAILNRQPVQYGLSEEQNAATKLRHLIVFPLLIQTRSNGSVTLGWESDLPTDFNLNAAQLMVNTIALAVESACLYYAQQSYIVALEYLGSLSMDLNLLPHATEVMDRATKIGQVLFNTQRCAVLLVKDSAIDTVWSCGLSPTFAATLPGADMGVWDTTADKNSGVSHAQVLGLNEIDSAGVEWREAFRVENIQSGMLVLLRGHARLLGGLAVFYDQPYSPSVYELRLLEILAAQVAVALDNIELNDANEQHADMLEQRVAARTQELAIALDKAEDADRLKTQLLSTVSHELRTPLAVIKAHATTTLAYYDRLPKERQLHYLTTINEETDRLTALINSLLDMSRLEAGRLEIRQAEIDPVPLFKELVDALQARFVERTFQWSIPAEIPAIYADEERVRQVVENLVDNASKYSPVQTPIEVGVQSWDDAMEIWVKDHGNGLTPEQSRRVFERFYQIDGSTNNARAGVGLGLAICKGLVEEMGGRIWCESAGSNKGSKFAFTLPWATKDKHVESESVST